MTTLDAVVVMKKRKSFTLSTSPPMPEEKPKRVAKPQPTEAEKAAKQAATQERQRAEQHTAKQKRRDENNYLLGVLGERWPIIFAPDAPTIPLKIGIDRDLMVALCPEYSPTKVRRVLGLYLYSLIKKRYLKALVAGGPRFDLDGQECGMVTEEEQERARVELAEMKMKGTKGEQEPIP